MKTLLQTLTLLLTALPMFGVGSLPFPGTVRFSESASYTAVPGGAMPGTNVTTLNQSFTAMLEVPALTNGPVPSDAPVQISFGNFAWTSSLGEAEQEGNCFSFDEGAVTVCIEKTKVTFSGKTTNALHQTIVPPEQPGTSNRVTGRVSAFFRLGAFSHDGPVEYTMKRTLTTITDGRSGRVQITGANDKVKPIVSILSPLLTQVFNSSSLSVTGRASDNFAVDRVEVRVNSTNVFFANAPVANIWSLTNVSLNPGTNVLTVTAIDLAGNRSKTVTTKVFRAMRLEIFANIGNAGTFTGGLPGLFYVPGVKYRLAAFAQPGFVFMWWSNSFDSVVTTNSVLSFVMTSGLTNTVYFARDRWSVRKGVFNGLFCATNQPTSVHNAGLLTLTQTENSRFSGKVQLAGRMFPFSGAWGIPVTNAFSQTTTVSVTRGLSGPLTLELELGLVQGDEVIRGIVSDGSWSSPLLAERVGDFGGAAPFAGDYTYATFPSDLNNTNSPQGSGPAMMKVTASGKVTVAGTLGDGRPYTAGGLLGRSGGWPLNVALNGQRGLLQGRIIVGHDRLEEFPSDPFCPTLRLLHQDFTSGDGEFVSVGTHLTNKWVYDAMNGDWRINGIRSTNATLTSPTQTVSRAGVVRMQFQHRYDFQTNFNLHAGQLRISVNGRPFELVPDHAFFLNPPSNSIPGTAFANSTERRHGFTGRSEGSESNVLIQSAASLGRFQAGDRLVIQFFAIWGNAILQTAPAWVISEVTLIEGDCYAVLGAGMKWIKPVVPKDQYYPGGFYDELVVSGHAYKPITALSTYFTSLDPVFHARGGNLSEELGGTLAITNNTLKVSGGNPSGLKLTVNPATGLFTTSFTNVATGRLSTGKGVLLQNPNQRFAVGHHLDADRTGAIILGNDL